MGDEKWQNRSGYYKDLQEYLATLEAAGKLVRVTEEINKDTELHPLVRLQFRGLPEEQRKAFLFENITDANGNHYDMPLALCAMAGSTDIYAMGLRCDPDDIADLWSYAQANPIAPVEVKSGPVKEVIIKGDDLEKGALTRLPVPISTPGFDNAPYTSASHWISKDPDSGLHNVGNYRGMVKSNTRIGTFPASPGFGLRLHIEMWRKKGIREMPAAIAIGVPPAISYTAVTRLPNDVCEYDVAGGLAGEPMELIRCETSDLLVPAQSQIVVEGIITTDEQEMEGPFGEFPGYMAARGYSWYMNVTCITMRKKPIYTAFISQLPPSESSKIRYAGWTGIIRRTLLEAGFDNVLDVHMPESSGSFGVLLVKIRKQKDDDGQRILEVLRDKFVGKVAIVVPEDIDIHEPDAVYWALSYNIQPHRDVRVDDINLMPLDPSVAPPGAKRGLNEDDKPRSTGLLIDATRGWDYPPTSLPRKEYMENAIRIWQKLGLPELKLKNPWYGYNLGYWSDEESAEAELAVAGRYFETGEKQTQERRKLDPDQDY
ncbi:MAG: UbiD family decarboxylase [Pseudomonadota bacterium]|nr:UbiD family decarboxylase [Pseudomonadota bacterium]